MHKLNSSANCVTDQHTLSDKQVSWVCMLVMLLLLLSLANSNCLIQGWMKEIKSCSIRKSVIWMVVCGVVQY